MKNIFNTIKNANTKTKIVLAIAFLCLIGSIINIFISNDYLQHIIWYAILFIYTLDLWIYIEINNSSFKREEKYLNFYLKILCCPYKYIINNDKEVYTKEEVLTLVDNIIEDASKELEFQQKIL